MSVDHCRDGLGQFSFVQPLRQQIRFHEYVEDLPGTPHSFEVQQSHLETLGCASLEQTTMVVAKARREHGTSSKINLKRLSDLRGHFYIQKRGVERPTNLSKNGKGVLRSVVSFPRLQMRIGEKNLPT